MPSSDSTSFSPCDCGLTVEGRASHGFDPTGDGGFSDLAQHLADRAATVERMLQPKDHFLLCVAVLQMQGFRKKVHCTVQQLRSKCLHRMYSFAKKQV